MEAILVDIREVVIGLVQQEIVYHFGVSSAEGEESREGDGMEEGGGTCDANMGINVFQLDSYGSTA